MLDLIIYQLEIELHNTTRVGQCSNNSFLKSASFLNIVYGTFKHVFPLLLSVELACYATQVFINLRDIKTSHKEQFLESTRHLSKEALPAGNSKCYLMIYLIL